MAYKTDVAASRNRWRSILLPAVALSILMLWMLSITWGSGYASLRWRDQLMMGYVSRDVIFHATYTEMLITYGRASTGLDGLPHMPYHFASHLVAAMLATLTHTSALTIYHFVFPWLLPTLYVAAFLSFVLSLRPRTNWRTSFSFWFVIVAGTVRILPQPIADTQGMWSTLFVSESALLGQALFFLGAAGIVRGYVDRSWFFRLIALPALCFALGLSKQSLLFVSIGGLAALFITGNRWRQRRYWACAVLVLLSAYLAYRLTIGTYETTNIVPLHFINTFTEATLPSWLLLNFGWAWLYIGLRVYGKRRPLTDVYVLAALIVAGLIPALLLEIPGGSAGYFVEIQRFVAVGLLAAWLPPNLWQLRARWAAWIRRGMVAACVLAVGNIVRALINFIIVTAVPAQPINPVVQQLDAIAALPIEIRTQTGLMIARDHPYHSMLRMGSLSCAITPFVAPALTGIAMIDGLPEACDAAQYYGYHTYPRHDDPPCVTAQRYGLTRLLILETIDRIIEYDCTHGDGTPISSQ